jgi:hypothetical protein
MRQILMLALLRSLPQSRPLVARQITMILD